VEYLLVSTLSRKLLALLENFRMYLKELPVKTL
jgi:hypothetical protein